MSRANDPAAAADAVDAEETVTLLRELVGIPSPYFEESEVVESVHGWLDDRGLDPEYRPVSEPEITGYEGRNVVARLAGSDPAAPTLVFNAHVDTVQIVDAWEEDPFSGRIEDGRLYGQGACDMKGGLAAAMAAFAALAEADADLAGDLLLTAVVDEEGPYGLGTDALLRDGTLDGADMAVVPEPGPPLAQSELANPALLLGARGRFLYDVAVTGRAAHGSRPDEGVNAVVDAGRIAAALDEMAVDAHPKLGSGSVCPLLIEGGSQTLSVPESARLLVDRHVVPGETRERVREQAEDAIAALDPASDVDVGFREAPAPEMAYGPYVTDPDHPLVAALTDAARTVSGVEPAVGYFASVGDFNYLGDPDRAGLPTVIFGPDGGNVHSAGEFVYVDDVVEVGRTLAAAATDLLG